MNRILVGFLLSIQKYTSILISSMILAIPVFFAWQIVGPALFPMLPVIWINMHYLTMSALIYGVRILKDYYTKDIVVNTLSPPMMRRK